MVSDPIVGEAPAEEWPPLRLPDAEDLAAMASLRADARESGPDDLLCQAAGRGLLRDLAPCLSGEPTLRGRRIDDLGVLYVRIGEVMAVLGYPEGSVSAAARIALEGCRIESIGQLPPEARGLIARKCRIVSAVHLGGRIDGPVDFSGSDFEGRVSIRAAQFAAGADFTRCVFADDCAMAASEFLGPVSFKEARFASSVDFNMTQFRGPAAFNEARFELDAIFLETTFHGPADFTLARFEDEVFFNLAAFRGPVGFRRGEFRGDLMLNGADFAEPLDLRNTKLGEGVRLSLHELRFRGSTVLGGNLRMRYDQLCLGRWPRHHGRILGERGPRDGRVTACEQYGIMEANFAAQGSPDAAAARDWCHYRYMDLHRLTRHGPGHPRRWMDTVFMKWCFGYGVFTKRILMAGLAMILLFALVYATNCFFLFPDSQWKVVNGSDTDAQTLGGGPWGDRMLNALYFSAITFATVGYGDWHPVHFARMFAAFEGLTGVVIMSVFTVSLSRKFLR